MWKNHNVQKSTRSHVPFDVANYVDQSHEHVPTKRCDSSCEPCAFNGKSVVASLFCPQCDNEFLCNACGKNHNAQKTTRSHVLCDVANYVDQRHENVPTLRCDRMCEPCTFNGKSVVAELFCLQSDNEFLCNECGKNYNAQKSTRSHVLSDIGNYVDPTIENLPTERCDRMCEPCTFNGKSVIAELFCSQCDNEFLCNECGKNHNAQKSTRNHVLSDIGNYVDPTIANLPTERCDRMCEPCTFNGKSVIAELFCPQCDNELLCNDCGKHHSAHMSTRTHVLSCTFEIRRFGQGKCIIKTIRQDVRTLHI
ncbi:hypothetical protein DPMN_169752 [Dreissena polymorpha]|uniref:Uncharacterized protein n=1 Tax=Dreissena polymorpha TaxID=45954 RepID=A0A9D4DWL3_DREPO|nr:hypothetical protein DPMN_169752 [Dreissena polymorpha]